MELIKKLSTLCLILGITSLICFVLFFRANYLDAPAPVVLGIILLLLTSPIVFFVLWLALRRIYKVLMQMDEFDISELRKKIKELQK